MYFGVDYYPEHWDNSMIEKDLSRMSEAGVNIVRIGEFAWHLMEKEEGKFDFSFFDMVVKKVKEYDMKIMFGTPTATFPAWLGNKYPEIYLEDINGDKMVFGGRRQYCYTSEIYKKYSERITRKLVEHYKNEESIIAWQIDNEFGHEGSDMCYCDKCKKGFQKFLKEKYKGIEKLNELYGTIFWGQTYDDFSQIPIPKKTITTHNPSLRLDWLRYRSYTLNSYAKNLVDIVKRYRGKNQEVTTNASGGVFDKYFDHGEQFKEFEFTSYDNYPVWGGLVKPLDPHEIAMSLDIIRGLKNENFWIVEQLMGAQGHDVIGYLPRPNQGKLWAHQGFAHGCSNMLWFRWRGMTRGAEQFCFGILDQDDKKGRKYNEMKDFISYMKPYEEVVNSPIKSKVAILYSHENIWSWKIQRQSSTFDFTKEMAKLYKPLYGKNLNIDILPVDSELDNYELIVVPNLMIISEELRAKLEAHLKKGGRIIFSYRSGTKDPYNNLKLGGELPYGIKKFIGAKVQEVESLGEGIEVELNYNGDSYRGEVWRDILELESGEGIVGYKDEFRDYWCVTKNNYLNGEVYYLGTSLEEELLEKVVDNIIKGLDLEVIEAPKKVEVYKREKNEKTYYFISNHTKEEQVVLNEKIEPYGIRIVEKN